jgi:hypothetical protein
MKKLLTLFLVLAMSTSSWAVLEMNISIDPDGPEGPMDAYQWLGEDVKPSDYIIVDLMTTDALASGMLETLTAITNGDEIVAEFSSTGWLVAGGEIREPGAYDTGFDVFFNSSTLMPFPAGWIWTAIFHVPDYKLPSDEIIIDPYGGNWAGTLADLGPDDQLPYIVLHVIPEPMTIALLGLGGLFLVRKRRK